MASPGPPQILRRDRERSPQPPGLEVEACDTPACAGTPVLWDWGGGTEALLFLSENPRDADPMTRVQAELDETKIILVRRM